MEWELSVRNLPIVRAWFLLALFFLISFFSPFVIFFSFSLAASLTTRWNLLSSFSAVPRLLRLYLFNSGSSASILKNTRSKHWKRSSCKTMCSQKCSRNHKKWSQRDGSHFWVQTNKNTFSFWEKSLVSPENKKGKVWFSVVPKLFYTDIGLYKKEQRIKLKSWFWSLLHLFKTRIFSTAGSWYGRPQRPRLRAPRRFDAKRGWPKPKAQAAPSVDMLDF